MTSHEDAPAVEARLDFVHARMLELQGRVAALEAQLFAPLQRPVIVPVQPLTHPPTQPSAHPPTSLPKAPPRSLAPAPGHAPTAEPVGDANSSDGPARALAIAGGGALLLGLAFFVGYAIEQDWLAPGVRFVLAAIASALLTLAAWPIARRGYEAVAGAIGGAGLGGWFAAWLVARHAHELVGAPQAFVALAAGAAACLLIADRLRLRLMAGLATLAACATPVLVATGGGRLHELMIYQSLVVVGLVILDARRRWPELPTIGLLATWLLGGGWAEAHLGPDNAAAFMAWSMALVGVSAASAWRLLSVGVDGAERGHVQLRLLIAGVASWAAGAAAFGIASPAFAGATLLLAGWHVGLAVFVQRREAGACEPFLALGWAQAMVFAPLVLGQALPAWWWIGLAVVATVVPWPGFRRLRGALVLLPAFAAIGWCVAAEQAWSPFVGLLAAAVVVGASVWGSADVEQPRPIPWLAIVGTLAWVVVVLALGPAAMLAQLGLALVPVLALTGWALARPTRQAQLVASTQLGLGLVAVAAAIADSDALLLRGSEGAGERLGLAVMLIVLGGFGSGLIARVRAAVRTREWVGEPPQATGLGLLIAAAGGGAALLLVALISGGAAALGQVGYSLSAAGVGLALIVAGLRLDDGVWRQAGLGVIAAAAGKVVLFDLAAAAVAWRALSFVGLGVILIAGAFAYSRAYRRALASAEA